jgi:hypothetical protein
MCRAAAGGRARRHRSPAVGGATPHGWILVGSTDANTYDAKVAFALDLGGNDR